MMYIEGHWETVDTFRDIERIVKEYYNDELANKMYELIEEQEKQIYNLEDQIDELECKIEDLSYSLEYD